jgi:two-component system phosphate regulon response regulator PhoB
MAAIKEKCVTQPRILVIDDDADIQELISNLLNMAGLEHIPALNAAAGVEVLKRKPLPDCLVLDLMMPDVSGIELLRQIRGKEVFNDLPIVILSALADPIKIRDGLNMGADRYVTKPYLVNSLTKTIFELLKAGRRVLS